MAKRKNLKFLSEKTANEKDIKEQELKDLIKKKNDKRE